MVVVLGGCDPWRGLPGEGAGGEGEGGGGGGEGEDRQEGQPLGGLKANRCLV